MSAIPVLDPEQVATDVAAAVSLAEGPAGVRAVVRAIGRGAGSTRAVGRETSLPLPLVAAVCGELRARGILTTDRPARLTLAGAAAFGSAPVVVGSSDVADLVSSLSAAAAEVPPVRVDLDQTHCTVETKVRRVLTLHEAGALAGRRLLVLGDDDLVSLAVLAFAARFPDAAPAALTVVEVDPALVEFLRPRLADAAFPAEVVEHDLRSPLPVPAPYDTVQTDPPYTVDGATLFLRRARSALQPGGEVFLSLGVRRPEDTVRLQESLVSLDLAVRSMTPGFNEYVGAGVLGGTSALWHLVVAADSATSGGLYTGEGRSRRRYVCATCATAQTVGEGRRWRTVGELKEAGCPRCGGRTFRPRKSVR